MPLKLIARALGFTDDLSGCISLRNRETPPKAADGGHYSVIANSVETLSSAPVHGPSDSSRRLYETPAVHRRRMG